MKMLRVGLVMFVVLVFLVNARPSFSQSTKYDLKSGIVTYDQEIRIGDTTQKAKIIVTFDDYGMKECRETFEGNVLTESFISDGKELLKILHKNKVAYKMGPAHRGTEMKFDWNEVSKRDKEKGRAKQSEPMTVAGKKCDSFTVTRGSNTTVYAGWKNILLYMELQSKSMISITRAITIEENPNIPAKKFAVPEGFTIEQQ